MVSVSGKDVLKLQYSHTCIPPSNSSVVWVVTNSNDILSWAVTFRHENPFQEPYPPAAARKETVWHDNKGTHEGDHYRYKITAMTKKGEILKLIPTLSSSTK